MKRGVILVAALLFFSAIVIITPTEVEAVGQPQINLTVELDYEGINPLDPIDLSTGFFGYDPPEQPMHEKDIQLHGDVMITSDYPHILQEIVVELQAQVVNDQYGEFGVEYEFDPELIIVTDLMPGETVTVNYTVIITLDGSIPAFENFIWIHGKWYHDPGPTGGQLAGYEVPLYIAPVISAGFSEVRDEYSIEPNDHGGFFVDYVKNGNVRDPDLKVEFTGHERVPNGALELEYRFETVVNDVCVINVRTGDLEPYDEYDIEVTMIDVENDIELSSFDFTIIIEEPYSSDDDDDDDYPPIGDDDDEEPIELLTEAQCERSYVDAYGDDLEYWATDDEDAGVEKGVKPEIDIKDVTVRRDMENLVITITTYGPIPEYTSFTVFILPDDTHIQPSLNLDPQDGDDMPDYQPDEYVDTNYLDFFWGPEEVIRGSTCTITWSLESLMEDGLTEDFEVFVQATYFDAKISGPISDPDFVIVYYNIDYAGTGAWEVGSVKGDLIDPVTMFTLSKLVIPAIIVGVVFLLIVLGVVFYVISRKRKNIFD